MFGFRRDAAVLNDILAGGDGYAGILVGPRHSQVVRGVCRELLATGYSPREVVALILLIVDLIQKVGPSVRAVVDAIRSRTANK